MYEFKKPALIFLVAAVLLLGLTGGFFICTQLESKLDRVIVPRAEYDELLQYSEKYGKAEALIQYVSENYYIDVDEDDLVEGLYYGIFDALDDSYSTYLNASEYQNLSISTSGDYSGVGITMSVSENGSYVFALAVTEDAPAEKAGVRAGDIIWKVDGTEYTGSQLDLCAAAVRGEAGTDVCLTIVRDNVPMDITITRARILAKTVRHEMLAGQDGIGYISISSFEDPTYADFKAALTDIEQSGAKGFVLDLRGNGGGIVDSAIAVADELMGEETVVYTEDNKGNRHYYTTHVGRTALPYVVLGDQYTASASEILAAGVQDNKEGEIVGTVTFGKGIIQNLQGLTDGSAVKLTVLQYFSPSGKTIHKKGITPDAEAELKADCYDKEGNLVNDLQLDKALDVLKRKVK